MSEVFRVAVHYENDNGFIEYDPVAKTATIKLETPEKSHEATVYFSTKQTLRKAEQSLVDFREWQAVPIDDLESFQAALGHLWVTTGIHVDWSRPV